MRIEKLLVENLLIGYLILIERNQSKSKRDEDRILNRLIKDQTAQELWEEVYTDEGRTTYFPRVKPLNTQRGKFQEPVPSTCN